MGITNHRPRRGDKFWDRTRFLERDGQPNGQIRYVDWENKEATVEFFDGASETYDFDELEGCWEPLFGGCYMIYPTR
jgi:hypothetical protein